MLGKEETGNNNTLKNIAQALPQHREKGTIKISARAAVQAVKHTMRPPGGAFGAV